MGGNLFKTIIAILMLALLAFLAGSLAADGAKQALMPVGLIIGAFVLLYLGKNCWWLLYAAASLLPLLGVSFFNNFPVAFALSAVLLLYWLTMYLLGKVKITWYGIGLLDAITGIFLVYFAITWILHPVYIKALVDDLLVDGDVMFGAQPYVWAAAALSVYIFISIVPVKLQAFIKILKIIVWLILPIALLGAVKIYLFGGGDELQDKTMGEAIVSGRFGAFSGVSRSLYVFLVCKYSVMGFIMSPLKAVLLVMAAGGIALSGFREQMMNAGLIAIVSQWMHRQLTLFVLLCLGVYGGLLYLSSETLLEDLPYGVKRVLSTLPGVEYKDTRAAHNANSTIEWRLMLWQWALTPSMGYIKDYVWGDGFGISAQSIRRTVANVNKGDYVHRVQAYAKAGGWHNGAIVVLHTTGGVGLAIVAMWSLVVLYYTWRLCFALRSVPGREYLYFYLIPTISTLTTFCISSVTYTDLFGRFLSIAIMKVTYVLARERGLIQPLFARKVYVPLMHREADEAGSATQKAALPLHS